VSIGFVTAFVFSSVVTFTGATHEPVFFDAAAIVPTVIYLGRWARIRGHDQRSVRLSSRLSLILWWMAPSDDALVSG
ncbi:hypothetical protein, partial [Ferrimicrobium acidiphilum]